MDRPGEADTERALRAIASMVERSEKAQARFAPGTAQHTLLENRINALGVASALVGQSPAGHPRAALEKARAPIASLIGKSEKALGKLAPGSWQHAMLEENLWALRLAAPLLEKALAKKGGHEGLARHL